MDEEAKNVEARITQLNPIRLQVLRDIIHPYAVLAHTAF